MAPFLDQVISLLYGPEGNLIYSIVLGLSVLAALVSCWYADSREMSLTGNRMKFGLSLLLAAQLLLIFGTYIAWGYADSHSFLPPLDRTLALLSLVLIIWLWAFPERHPIGDLVATVLAGLFALLGLGGLILWMTQNQGISYNSSTLEGFAYFVGLGLVIAGLILLVVRKPTYWRFGALMLGIIFAGYVGQYFYNDVGVDFDLYIHLGTMVGYMALLALPLRLVDLRQAVVSTDKTKTSPLKSQQTSTLLIQSILNLLSEPSPQKYYQELLRVVALFMNADFSLLLMPPKTGDQLIMPIGYNRGEDRMIDGLTSNGRKMPILLDAIKNGKNMQLSGLQESEIQTLAEALGLNAAANFLMVPFHPKGANIIMSLAMLSGSSDRAWTAEDASQLVYIEQLLVSVAGQYSKGAGLQGDQGEIIQKLKLAEAAADQTRLEYTQLKAKYDSISTKTAVSGPLAMEMAALLENQKNLQGTITQLETRNHELESLLTRGRPSVEEVEQLRQELRAALADLGVYRRRYQNLTRRCSSFSFRQ
jgi:hypothetical protein